MVGRPRWLKRSHVNGFFRSALGFAFIGAAVAFTWRAFHPRATSPDSTAVSVVKISTEPAVSSSAFVPAHAASDNSLTETGVSPLTGRESVDSLLVQIGEAMRSSDDASWNRLLNELFPVLLRRDRAAAIRVVENTPFGEKREQLLRRLARAWAAADFEGAVGWLGSLARTEDQKPGFEEACFGAMDSNPGEAVRVWEKCAFTADDHVLANLTQNWATKDLEAARAWVMTRPPGLQRDQAVARIAFVLAQSKPADAATLAVREIPPGPAQIEAVISVLHRWAESDPAGATAWVANFSDPTLRDRAIGELAGITQKSR